MAVIRIQESGQSDNSNGSQATISFDNGPQYPITISDPFSEPSQAQEQLLEWYFEEHLVHPYLDQVKAQQAATSIRTYGEQLFHQIFRANPDVYSEYKSCLQAGLNILQVEIAGSPSFHRWHWESLADPQLPQPLVLQATMIRKNLQPSHLKASLHPSPIINVLVVTARPFGKQDVGYRTISRPLVEELHRANLRVQVDILRPGTYKALADHLRDTTNRHGVGHYHVIHFDVHGAVLPYDQFQQATTSNQYLFQQRYGRPDIKPYEGMKAFLFLEGEQQHQADPVEASELANLLVNHQVPITILNACQSGKQIGASETSLGSRLMQAGVQTVLAMGYSVTVSAAKLLIGTLYSQFFANNDLSTAIRSARQELYNAKGRQAYYGYTIDLEDWLLPVVYQNQPQLLRVCDLTPEESVAYYGREEKRYPQPHTNYGFVGRDLDILYIERYLLLKRNILLVRGMGGAGKTTLLHHLGFWWQTTGFVKEVFYFGYDERAWTRQQILHRIAQQILSPVQYASEFQPLGLIAQQKMLASRLRAERHLLILDNLESITGAQLAIQHTLPSDEQSALHDFLSELVGGHTLILLGSRSSEAWLARDTFDNNIYDLPGLDPEAASTLTELILKRQNVTHYRKNPDLQKLIKLLDGFPLALEVVLTNLAHQTPAQVLEALRLGDIELDTDDSQKKTESILRCIDYSHSNLSPDAQSLLLCLAPFTLVLNRDLLQIYTEHLQQQPSLASLPFDRWSVVLQEAQNWGLLSPDPDIPQILRLQPVLTYFLRSRLSAPEQAEMRIAIESAFRKHYGEVGEGSYALLTSKDPQERQVGQVFASLEYENVAAALDLGLAAQDSILSCYQALDMYLDAVQEWDRRLELATNVDERLQAYPADQLTGLLGSELVIVLDRVAYCQLKLRQYAAAETSYQKALAQHLRVGGSKRESASIYHQLGWVAQEQRRWEEAEQYYQQALQIDIEYNARYDQAKTYHNLGLVAQEQRKWEQAEQYYQQALQIYVEYNARYDQAKTYHNLGLVAREQGKWEQAEQYYQQALQIWIEFNDRYEQASTYHHLGWVAQEQRKWEQAEQYYQQALQIEIECNVCYEQAGTYHQLGMVAQEQRKWEQAEQYYQQALQIKIEYNARYEQASTYYHLGWVAQEQRKWEQARPYFIEALKISVDYEDTHSANVVLRSLARLWQESGDASLPAVVASILSVTPNEAEAQLREALGDTTGEAEEG